MPIEPQPQQFKFLTYFKAVFLLAGLVGCCAGKTFAQAAPGLSVQTQTNPPASNPAGEPVRTGSKDDLPDGPKPAASRATTGAEVPCEYPPCYPPSNWYARFVNGPQEKPLSPKDKGWLAARNFVDPFNAITILGEGAIYIGADSHSDYGPGMSGFGKYVGVSFTQDLTGEFFNTFLIPSVVHQDPHYHRMQRSSYSRRVVHAIAQVVWTQGDNGKGMLNYSNLVGYAIDDEISNLYVPGRATNVSATAQRYGIALATTPIGNVITEFLPDVARHIHVQIVVVQRIINQVAKTDQ